MNIQLNTYYIQKYNIHIHYLYIIYKIRIHIKYNIYKRLHNSNYTYSHIDITSHTKNITCTERYIHRIIHTCCLLTLYIHTHYMHIK